MNKYATTEQAITRTKGSVELLHLHIPHSIAQIGNQP